MINLYWNIGKVIGEKQEGNIRTKCSDYLIENTAKKLTDDFRKVFSTRNLKRISKLYLYYSKMATLLSQLTWSYYFELIKISEEAKKILYARMH